jgi:hypothetical protein
MLALGSAALAGTGAAMVVVMMVMMLVVMVMMMVVMIMIVVMMMLVEMMVMHRNTSSLLLFVVLYPQTACLSKHLFLREYPRGGLAKAGETMYNNETKRRRRLRQCLNCMSIL